MRDVQKILDEVAFEIERTVREVEKAGQRIWSSRSAWKRARPARSAIVEIRQMPDRLSDLAVDGSCVMRYLLAYILKGIAVLQGFSGLVTVAVSGVGQPDWNLHQLCAGLALVVTAQLFWWAGHLMHKSADRKRYAQYQHRLLKLARQKGGSLTILEAATDGRITVEKAEEILRELAARGHAEVRVSESGLIVYHFPEIERWDEKHWAKPIDEL